ncbi:retrovirus-related pol polyprotein from transposon TNT 1-94 [Tanacetum coccineum]
MCVVNMLKSVNETPTVKAILNNGKQIWKLKGKLSNTSLNKTKRVWKATGKLFANVGYQWRPTGKKFTLGKLCPLTRLPVACCSKHMTGNRSKLRNFMEKFIRTVRFGNNHVGAIMGYGDYMIGDSVISRVYYVEGLGHNLFSVGQFCDSDLEVAFRKHSCFVRNMDGVDLLKGCRGTNLYTISVDEMLRSSPICLLSKASKSKSWLWHRRLNHLNFGTINDLARKDLVRGLPRLKYEKDHLCSACQLGKSKKFSHKPKSKNTNMEVLHTLHMDLCGPMRVHISSKVCSENSTTKWRCRTMKSYTCGSSTYNADILKTTDVFLVHDNKPDLTFLRVFGALCYPTNDSEDLVKLQAKADIGIFVGYAPYRKGFRIYILKYCRIMETIHVTFDELHQSMAHVHISSRPEPMSMTPGQFSSGIIPNQVYATNYVLRMDKI